MKKLILLALFFFFYFTNIDEVSAQCPMCKSAVESSMKDGKSTAGRGLNTGILYLLSAPYLAVGIIGAGWYIKSKKRRKDIK